MFIFHKIWCQSYIPFIEEFTLAKGCTLLMTEIMHQSRSLVTFQVGLQVGIDRLSKLTQNSTVWFAINQFIGSCTTNCTISIEDPRSMSCCPTPDGVIGVDLHTNLCLHFFHQGACKSSNSVYCILSQGIGVISNP